MAAWRTSTSPCWTCRATGHPPDPEAYLRTAIAWHFGADTGSPFWLRAAQDPRLRSADRGADLRRPAPVSQSGRRTAQCPRRRPHPPRLRVAAADPPHLRIRWHHGRAQTHRAAARLGRAGHAVAGRGFHCWRICTWPRASVPDAERPTRRWALRPRGRRTAGLGVSPDRPGSAVGQEARRPKRGRRRWPPTWTTCWSRRRYILQTQDVVNLHATPPLVEAIARNDGLVDLVNSKIRYLLLSGAHVDMDTARPASPDLPEHRDRDGVRQHDGAVAGGDPQSRATRSSSTRARRTSSSG